MTTSTVRLLHCDFAGCDAKTPDTERGYVADRPDGWKNLIYTHGCPDHRDAIAAHKADLTSETRGRGYKEKTTWYLRCACGWSPRRNWATHNYGPLTDAHLKHVAEVTADRDYAENI